VAVLDHLPREAVELPRRPAWAERARHYAHAASVVLPEHRARIEALADGVEAALARTDPGPVVPTHGDLYEANLLMTDGRVSTLLDVDALGPGHRVDDLACLLAHVSVLPHLAPLTYPAVPAVLETWTAMCARRVDSGALHARAAGVVLSLIAGARRWCAADWRAEAEGRLAVAERWLAGARRASCEPSPLFLRALSSSSVLLRWGAVGAPGGGRGMNRRRWVTTGVLGVLGVGAASWAAAAVNAPPRTDTELPAVRLEAPESPSPAAEPTPDTRATDPA